MAKRNLARNGSGRILRRLRLVYVAAASLLLHGIVISAVYFSADKNQYQMAYDLPIEVSFQDALSEVNSDSSTSKPVDKSFGSGAERPSIAHPSDLLTGGFRKQTLQKFVQSSKASSTANGPWSTDTQGDAAATGHGWSRAVQVGNSMDIHETFATLPFFMALHAKVDSNLVYPDDFSRQRITGNVRIEAELDRDGRLLRFVGSVAQDKVLQTYCLAFLLQALKHPLPQRAWAKSSLVVAFEFDFHTHIPGEPQRLFPTVIEKNRLAFGRDNQIEPWLNERINEVFTHYIPPIVPLPGGVYIDFVLAYQFMKNLIEGAPTERELRQGRIESLHLHLKDFLQHQAVPTPHPNGTANPES